MITQSKTFNKISANDLAEFVLKKSGELSHLKLQKLIYYIQGYHLGMFDEPLFEEDFEAWVHGPVQPELFHAIKDISRLHDDIAFIQDDGVPEPEVKLQGLNMDQHELIEEIIREFGHLSGMQLEAMTHSEAPWKDARRGIGPGEKCNNIISKESMRSFFKSELNAQA
ncbi:MAG: Panacea domain-containing protein [Bacteroidales bacterium]